MGFLGRLFGWQDNSELNGLNVKINQLQDAVNSVQNMGNYYFDQSQLQYNNIMNNYMNNYINTISEQNNALNEGLQFTQTAQSNVLIFTSLLMLMIFICLLAS